MANATTAENRKNYTKLHIFTLNCSMRFRKMKNNNRHFTATLQNLKVLQKHNQLKNKQKKPLLRVVGK